MSIHLCNFVNKHDKGMSNLSVRHIRQVCETLLAIIYLFTRIMMSIGFRNFVNLPLSPISSFSPLRQIINVYCGQNWSSIKPGTWTLEHGTWNMEHSGTSLNIPEHRISMGDKLLLNFGAKFQP